MYLTRAAGIETAAVTAVPDEGFVMYLTRAAGIETRTEHVSQSCFLMYLTRAAGIETFHTALLLSNGTDVSYPRRGN